LAISEGTGPAGSGLVEPGVVEAEGEELDEQPATARPSATASATVPRSGRGRVGARRERSVEALIALKVAAARCGERAGPGAPD